MQMLRRLGEFTLTLIFTLSPFIIPSGFATRHLGPGNSYLKLTTSHFPTAPQFVLPCHELDVQDVPPTWSRQCDFLNAALLENCPVKKCCTSTFLKEFLECKRVTEGTELNPEAQSSLNAIVAKCKAAGKPVIFFYLPEMTPPAPAPSKRNTAPLATTNLDSAESSSTTSGKAHRPGSHDIPAAAIGILLDDGLTKIEGISSSTKSTAPLTSRPQTIEAPAPSDPTSTISGGVILNPELNSDRRARASEG
ncbi:hypothetical protein D9611_007579 [Ephemerocybe angulata]|uniref:Uncharacterized protein n=1 Tax=Ephemerocybe angulata TaxID=980116 RepID=A0A8H5C076_9AGAR|nr:hypothetical protein D9611_007579 [Tulosesus angulatus]